MSHKFTIDDFTLALQGKNPELDQAMEGQKNIGEMIDFVDRMIQNTMTAPASRRRKVQPVKRKIRRGVGSY